MELVAKTEWNEDDDPADRIVGMDRPVADHDSDDGDTDQSVESALSSREYLSKQWRDHPPLTAEEERKITDRYFASDRARWKDIMVMSCSRFAAQEALKLKRRFRGKSEGLEDLYQRIMMGISVAADRYDPASGTRFISFAGNYKYKYMADLFNVALKGCAMFHATSAVFDKPASDDPDSTMSYGEFITVRNQLETYGTGSCGNRFDRRELGDFVSFVRRRVARLLDNNPRVRSRTPTDKAGKIRYKDKLLVIFEFVFLKNRTMEFVADMFGETCEGIRQKAKWIHDAIVHDVTEFPGVWRPWVGSDIGLLKIVSRDGAPDAETVIKKSLYLSQDARPGSLHKEKDEEYNVISDYGPASARFVSGYHKFTDSVYQRKYGDMIRHSRPFYGHFYSQWSRYHRFEHQPVMSERLLSLNIACGNLPRKPQGIEIRKD